ncbi:MAG: altronate dehydratase [Clostridiales bacterium]|nr:altronate dehydratase [Clostridiales bacterium]
MKAIKIHPNDHVAVALSPIAKGESVTAGKVTVTALEEIAQGHKIALCAIGAGENVRKYGFPIGHATQDIAPGQWVHTHNVKTNLSGELEYTYNPVRYPLPEVCGREFMGFLRADGSVGVRNEIWIIPTVGCVNSVAEKLVRDNQHLVQGSVEGLHTFTHPYGCSQMGEDHENTRRLLCALSRHPNAGGVLVLSLGCENLTMEQFKQELGAWDEKRVKFLCCQDVEDEYEAGAALLEELSQYAQTFRRQPLPASRLIIGMKCGGSDGLSGITANPCVGAFSDLLIAMGGSTILTEVPEMFGAETLLMDRAKDDQVFQKTVDMVNGFKQYYVSHNQVVYENPSPGNKAGGITTLEDKSLGCVQKGGSAPVSDVIGYGERGVTPGLNLLTGPGNDLVSATALTAAGAHLILFTTGRGTPFGAPAPTVKIATNSRLFTHKKGWMDFNAGTVAEGESIPAAGERLLEAVLEYAGGKKTVGEINGCRGIAIFKDGVTL